MQQTKTIFTLNIDNYCPEIVKVTRPYLYEYADKIDAEIYEITDRLFPTYPVTYEKMQIHALARHGSNWNIYVDSDALIHPDTPDFTAMLPMDTVMHHGTDVACYRWKMDDYFLRDGRMVASCNWFTIASWMCLDLWKPQEEPADILASNIYPFQFEEKAGVTREHLIDDYSLSRNIARFGLKCTTAEKLLASKGYPYKCTFWHEHTVTQEEKVKHLKQALVDWGLAEGDKKQEVVFSFGGRE